MDEKKLTEQLRRIEKKLDMLLQVNGIMASHWDWSDRMVSNYAVSGVEPQGTAEAYDGS